MDLVDNDPTLFQNVVEVQGMTSNTIEIKTSTKNRGRIDVEVHSAIH